MALRTATHEWNLTADLPVTGANLGMEGITWIPDAVLVARGVFDGTKGRAYNALDHRGGSFTRIATISTDLAGVIDLRFDRDPERSLGCLRRYLPRAIGGAAHRPVGTGRFTPARRFERPTGMPNLNNEGFAIAPATQCSGNTNFVFWIDDGETDGHALRSGGLSCTAF